MSYLAYTLAVIAAPGSDHAFLSNSQTSEESVARVGDCCVLTRSPAVADRRSLHLAVFSISKNASEKTSHFSAGAGKRARKADSLTSKESVARLRSQLGLVSPSPLRADSRSPFFSPPRGPLAPAHQFFFIILIIGSSLYDREREAEREREGGEGARRRVRLALQRERESNFNDYRSLYTARFIFLRCKRNDEIDKIQENWLIFSVSMHANIGEDYW